MRSRALSLVSFTSLLQCQNTVNIYWLTFYFRLSIVCMHVLLCVFLRVLMCAGACAHVCMHVEAQDIVYLPISLFALNAEVGLHIFSTSLTAQFDTVIPCSCLCHAGIIDKLSYPPGLSWALELELWSSPLTINCYTRWAIFSTPLLIHSHPF